MSHDVKVNSKKFAPFLAGLSFLLCAATSAPNYKDILASPDRPDNEKAIDSVRKPDEVMAFYGVKAGDKVADLMASRGYYTAILSQLVGPEGVVYAANMTPRLEIGRAHV